MRNLLVDIANLLLPRHCVICGSRLSNTEHAICTKCTIHLPFTNYHKLRHSPLEKYFWTVFPVERAVALFHYDGTSTRQMLHVLKYSRRPDVGYNISRYYARELASTDFFSDIDCIIPIPLAWQRHLRRGYNQSHYIAKGIKRETGIAIYTDVVRRTVNNATQTHLTRLERKENVEGIFTLIRPEKIENKHILLVDDVTTTGATIASCGKELAKATGVRISVLTLAIAARTPAPLLSDDTADPASFGMVLAE